MSKAARGGPAGSAADDSLEGATVAEGTDVGSAVTWGVADATGDATGTGELVLPQPASAKATSTND
jgi:hypothetical protein